MLSRFGSGQVLMLGGPWFERHGAFMQGYLRRFANRRWRISVKPGCCYKAP